MGYLYSLFCRLFDRLEIVVENYKWLSKEEFSKGIALAQMTPGPILNISVYIGYKLAGLIGGVIAAVGMFVPGMILMQLFSIFHSRLFNNVFLKKVITGILIAFNGVIIDVLISLFREGVSNKEELMFFIMLILINLKFKIKPIFLIIGSVFISLIIF